MCILAAEKGSEVMIDWLEIYLTGFVITFIGMTITTEQDHLLKEYVGILATAFIWPFFWGFNLGYYIYRSYNKK